MSINWKKRTVLVTGGTGSFGRRFAEIILREYEPAKLIIFSRDELKQHEMQTSGMSHPALRFFIGDVRDRNRLSRAFRGVDIVVHAAALKQVPACEYNPIEAIATNVDGAKNIVDAALDAGVSLVLGLSTDKAVNPVNLYGATKLCAEKLLIQSNSYSSNKVSRISCVRYGNVVGSRGSVIPLFLKQRAGGRVTITEPNMTRFWITLDQGVRFVIKALERMQGGEVFVPKLPSMGVMDLVQAIAPGCEQNFIGIRPGERIHEILISAEESPRVVDLGDMYVVQPAYPWWNDEHWRRVGTSVPAGFRYSSERNEHRLTQSELQAWVKDIA